MSVLHLASIDLSKLVFVVFDFLAIPWAVFKSGPEMGIHGVLQLGFILLMIVASLWRFRSVKASMSMRFQLILQAYLMATLITNVIVFALISERLH